MASHIDDFLHTGDESFDKEVMEKLRSKFLAGKLEEGIFKYVGFKINQREDGIAMEQTEYVEDLENIKLSPQRASQKQDMLNIEETQMLRRLVGRLNWVVQGTRPDLAFEMIDLSTTFKRGTVCDLLRAIKAIRKLKENHSVIVFPYLGLGKYGK